jgi:hypothetical protein
MAEDESQLPYETLVSRAGNSNFTRDPDIWSRYIALANAKMGIENNNLVKRTQELTEKQIEVSSRANELTEKLLLSNEEASKQGEKNAELMYKATVQLAKSTRSLNWATWVLVIFTAVQAFIAIAGFLKNK